VTILYGIKNCDSVKKARLWLQDNQVDYQFHDFREDGIEKTAVLSWIKLLGWETLINKRSTSWKQLDAAVRDKLDADSAAEVILQQPTLIKRPLLDRDGQLSVGFKDSDYHSFFK
jgi:Spx/MgsR family transcriptional regulator